MNKREIYNTPLINNMLGGTHACLQRLVRAIIPQTERTTASNPLHSFMLTEDNPNMKEVHVAYLQFISFLHISILFFDLVSISFFLHYYYDYYGMLPVYHIIKEIDSLSTNLHLSHVDSRRFIKKEPWYIHMFVWMMNVERNTQHCTLGATLTQWQSFMWGSRQKLGYSKQSCSKGNVVMNLSA